MSRYNKNLGNLGETIAATYLKNNHYKILEHNFNIYGGEIDLVAQKNDEIIFIEVKTRIQSEYYPQPTDIISPKQRRTLINTGKIWLISRLNLDPMNIYWQIDVISIILKKNGTIVSLKHFVNAIYWFANEIGGPLAQLVEQRAFNPRVAGSSPARLTIYEIVPLL